MARKKHQEEHENLERWLVSYADFMTLLFATFVVLYGLAMSNAQDYVHLQDSLERAFAAPSLFEGSESIINEGGKDQSIFDNNPGDSMVPPLLELLSPKYEEESFKKIKEAIEKDKDLKDVKAEIDERGLVINILDSDLLFETSSTKLSANSTKVLDKVGKLIKSKFNLHNIRVEGHTDNLPLSSPVYPSNWELSAARAGSVARYLMGNFSLNPNLFAVVGYGETRPIAPNDNATNRKKNRRVDIIVLKNSNSMKDPDSSIHSSLDIYNTKNDKPIKNLKDKKIQKASNDSKIVDVSHTSPAVKAILEEGKSKDVIIIKDKYEKESENIAKQIEEYESSIKAKSKEKLKTMPEITTYSAEEKNLTPSSNPLSQLKKMYKGMMNSNTSSGE